jgi:Ku protein
VKVDADTGDEVSSDDLVKGYQVDRDRYLEVTKDELENIALESTRTIDIDEFVPRKEIDDLYLVRPYYIVPVGKVGHDAYAVIRETIRSLDKVALARVVLTSREHVIALEARDKGLMGMLLRYPYEVRDQAEYFDEIQDVKITKDMLDLAKHIAGISRQGIYLHFKNKDEIFSASIQKTLDNGLQAANKVFDDDRLTLEANYLKLWMSGLVDMSDSFILKRLILGLNVSAFLATLSKKAALHFKRNSKKSFWRRLRTKGADKRASTIANMLCACGLTWKHNFSSRQEFLEKMRDAIYLCCQDL